MKVAFVVGHHNKSKGAYSRFGSEWDFYNEVMECLDSPNVFYHNSDIRGYNNRIINTAYKLNQLDFDLVIELHFNASANPQANGCETLYWHHSVKGKEYAKLFSKEVNDHTGIKLRNNGLKALTYPSERGYGAVYYPSAPTILIEPFFGTNECDCDLIKDARNMSIIINNFLKTIK